MYSLWKRINKIKNMRTQIFFYNNFIGAVTDIENGKFLNDVHGPSQLGCVVPIDEIDITPEAVEALKKAEREGGSFAPIMIDRGSIGLMGFRYHMFDTREPLISRDCDLSALDLCNIIPIELPEGFVEAIDIF